MSNNVVKPTKEMTHNQYQEFLKANASKLYTDSRYTLEDYKKDADSVVVLDFDLDKYDLADGMKRVVNRFFDTDDVSKQGNALFRGHLINDDYIGLIAKNLGCSSVSIGAYNGFYKSDENKCVLEFCEGDIFLVLCETEEAYRDEVASYYEFYEVDKDDWWEGFEEVSSEKVDSSEVCLKVFFDGVHMDNVYVPANKVDVAISSIVQHGYDDYNGAVKDDWKKHEKYNPNPHLSFEVEKAIGKSVDELIADATQTCEDVNKDCVGKGSVEFDKE